MLPFQILSTTDFTLKNLVTKAEQEVMLRYGRLLHQAKGYQIMDTTRSRYLGDPNRYLVRYRFNYNNKIRLSINMDKDAGEPFLGINSAMVLIFIQQVYPFVILVK